MRLFIALRLPQEVREVEHAWIELTDGTRLATRYWLPVDARQDRRSRWLANSSLTDTLQATFAKHVMVVADSCYSGTLTRSIKAPERRSDYIAHMAEKRARVVLSPGQFVLMRSAQPTTAPRIRSWSVSVSGGHGRLAHRDLQLGGRESDEER